MKNPIDTLDKNILLEMIESSCIYLKTLKMEELTQPAMIEETYTDNKSFNEAIERVKSNPKIKTMNYYSIPTIMDELLKLYDPGLIYKMDNVFIQCNYIIIVRFKNTSIEQLPLSHSIILPINTVKMRVNAFRDRQQNFSADHTIAYIVGAVVTVISLVIVSSFSSKH